MVAPLPLVSDLYIDSRPIQPEEIEKEGARLFYSNPHNIDLLKEQNIAMVLMAKGTVSEEDEHTITTYLDLVHRIPLLATKHLGQCEQLLREYICEAEKIRDPSEVKNVLGRYRKMKQTNILGKARQPEDIILARYLVLQSELILPVIDHRKIRAMGGTQETTSFEHAQDLMERARRDDPGTSPEQIAKQMRDNTIAELAILNKRN